MEELRNDLIKFVKEDILSKDYDGIVPIERRGFALLNLIKNELPTLSQLLVSAESLCPSQIEGKRLVVFDDTVRRGKKLNDVVNNLRERGAKVDTVVFVVHQLCPKENRPRKPKFDKYYNVNEEKYVSLNRDIIELLLLAGRPLDIDHLEIRLMMDPAQMSPFLDLIKLLGYVYEIPSIANQNGIRLYTLDEPIFFILEIAKPPPMVRKEGVTKIRFWLQPTGETFCVPMTYPIIVCDRSFSVETCKVKVVWERPFCKEFKDEFDPNNLRTCRDCIIFHLHESLGYNFFKALSEHNFKISLLDAGFESLRLRYKDKHERLSNFIKERIQSLTL